MKQVQVKTGKHALSIRASRWFSIAFIYLEHVCPGLYFIHDLEKSLQIYFNLSDCLSHETQIKVSAVLKNMVTVGSVNCAEEEALCKLLGRRSGSVFYPAKQVAAKYEIVCLSMFMPLSVK